MVWARRDRHRTRGDGGAASMVTRSVRATSESEPQAPKTRPKVNILVVDDDATKRFALRTILLPLDENIVEASSGADALRQLLRNEFAVVLLDVRMPIMDGFETAQLIRQRPRSEVTPLIFVTPLDLPAPYTRPAYTP